MDVFFLQNYQGQDSKQEKTDAMGNVYHYIVTIQSDLKPMMLRKILLQEARKVLWAIKETMRLLWWASSTTAARHVARGGATGQGA
jgi:hypothetical protein